MATDTLNVYQDFAEQVGLEIHQLHTDMIKACLTNTAPTATHATYSQIEGELGAGNGYTVGGEDCTNTWSESSGTAKLVCVNVVWTASGAVGPFTYVIFYNDTPANKNLIGWVEYPSEITMASGDTFTLDIDAAGGILTLGPPA
jgi:hypothetical protein